MRTLPPEYVDVTQWQLLMLCIWTVPFLWGSTGCSLDKNLRVYWNPASFGNCWARIVWAAWIISSFSQSPLSSKPSLPCCIWTLWLLTLVYIGNGIDYYEACANRVSYGKNAYYMYISQIIKVCAQIFMSWLGTYLSQGVSVCQVGLLPFHHSVLAFSACSCSVLLLFSRVRLASCQGRRLRHFWILPGFPGWLPCPTCMDVTGW